jgi:hypothetical protein
VNPTPSGLRSSPSWLFPNARKVTWQEQQHEQQAAARRLVLVTSSIGGSNGRSGGDSVGVAGVQQRTVVVAGGWARINTAAAAEGAPYMWGYMSST